MHSKIFLVNIGASPVHNLYEAISFLKHKDKNVLGMSFLEFCQLCYKSNQIYVTSNQMYVTKKQQTLLRSTHAHLTVSTHTNILTPHS